MAKKEAYRILLPTDGSIPALAATKHAVELVKKMGGRLIVLTVKEPNPVMPLERLAEDTVLMRAERFDGIEYAKRLADQENVAVELQTREGSVAGEIIKTAEELGVDMIVMGSSNPKGLSGFFLGHIADAVIKATPISVMVIKPTQKDILSIKENARVFIAPAVGPVVQRVGDGMKFKVGLALFFAYALGYVGYTVLGSFNKAILSIRLMGINLGIIGGMTLIFSAILIAVLYNWYAGRLEKRSGVA
jgi:nucleotide-binding universal stress UspA family protein/uncharacterized membrane protein (DUF485 family)